MARFRSRLTGSVVNVDDVTAGQLDNEWESLVKAEAPAKAGAPRRKSAK